MPPEGKSSKTMRIDIPPYIPPGREKPSIARRSKTLRHTESISSPAKRPDAILPPRKTDLIPIEDTDFKELFRQVYDAAFITRLKGRIVDANIRASQFFAYTRGEFRQHNIMDIVEGLDDAVLQTICENLEHDQFTLIQARCVRKDGSQFPAEISTSRLRLTTRDCLCFFIRDITARREAEEALKRATDRLASEVNERARINAELQAAVAQLQEHDRARSQFVSNVSHELKTPLTSIDYSASNMLRGVSGSVPDHARTYLEMIRQDCQRLKRTVDDILDMSRIEAGALNVDHVNVHFPRFVERTVESLRVQIEAENLTLYVNIGGGNSFVMCDPQKMERVFFNLLKNAIKYNTPGGSIGVDLHMDAEHPGFVTVDVTDSGVGIEPQYLPRVTERFFRVGEHVSGAGLGLHICKELLERHGGAIEIKSPPPGRNKGTQASFRIPVIVPPLLLIVCADEHIRLSLMKALDASGYRVAISRGGDTEVESPGDMAPDLILVDWIQEGMEGGIAIAKLKAKDGWRDIPIIAMTGGTADGPKREILEGLGIPVLHCPWQPQELLNCLDGAMMEK